MIKKIFASLGVITLLVILTISPLDVSMAQDVQEGFVKCEGTDCSFCNLVEMANEVIKWLIGILFFLFAVLMFSAGWGMVTSSGNESALSSAKDRFKNAIIGIIIVLAAWLLIDTILRGLLKSGNGELDGWGFWAEVKCQEQTAAKEFVREGGGPDQNSVDPTPGVGAISDPNFKVNAPAGAGNSLTHEQAVGQLAPGVKISTSGGCFDKGNPRCTSLEGVKQNTISRVNEIVSAVGAEHVVITGGTEAGHANSTYSHSNGYKIDFRTTPELNQHITDNFEKIGENKYKDANGNTYWRHGPNDHWDVTITN